MPVLKGVRYARVSTVARAITSARKSAGLTKADLARRVGVTRSMVSQWELGWAKPRIDRLRKIAKITDSDIDDLIKSMFGGGS